MGTLGTLRRKDKVRISYHVYSISKYDIRSMIKEQILKDLKETLKKLNFKVEKVSVERPTVKGFGDYTSNISLQLAKIRNSSPYESAKLIETNFPKKMYLLKVEASEKGFLNFYLSKDFLQQELSQILSLKETYLSSKKGQGKKARVEFVSANPTGPLHIGNARGGPIGDVLANVLETVGFEVVREYYDNNIGGQVKKLGATVKAVLEGKDLEEFEYKGEYIKELSLGLKNKIKGKSDEEAGKVATAVLFQEIIKDAEAMGIKFDEVTHEDSLQKEASAVVETLKKKGVVKEKDGALWLAPNDEFLKDRETVLVKSDGSYTYFTDDIAYHQRKFASGADLIVNVLGSNHSGHVPRIKAAVSALGHDTNKLRFILYQYVRVKRGQEILKMSKRAGNFVTASEVLEEVGKDAFRFFLLLSKPESHMDFDLDLAKKKTDENPVFYVQYAFARMSNILNKSENPEEADLSLLNDKEELVLIRTLIKGKEIIEEVSVNLNPHLLAFYSFELAGSFHRFYEKIRVIGDNPEQTKARLSLVKASKTVLEGVLEILGIDAPEKM